MIKELRTNVDATIQAQAVMKIANPSLSVDDAVSQLEMLGNTILYVDKEKREIKVLDTTEYLTEEVWVCEKCYAYSRDENKIIEHEVNCNGSKSSQ